MKFYAFLTIALLAATASKADYVCSFQNSLYELREYDSSWVNLSSVDVAINLAENKTTAIVNARKRINDDNRVVSVVYVACFDAEGNTAAVFKTRTGPNCAASALTGSYSCDDLLSTTTSLE